MNIFNRNVTVVLVEPEYQGNIGAVARVMKNTGFENLAIIGTRVLDDDAFARAKGGSAILERAKFYESMDEIRGTFDLLVSTSSVSTSNFKKFRRIPTTPGDIWKNFIGENTRTALIFGREGDGLKNSEISMCDCFVNIPSDPEYPVYNLSHAVGIMLYESLMIKGFTIEKEEPATSRHIDLILEKTTEIMEKTRYPKYKVDNTTVMLRRIFARSALTEHEFYKIMGILKKIKLKIDGSGNQDDSP